MAGSRFMESAPILVAEATAMRDGIAPPYKPVTGKSKLKAIIKL